MSWPPPTYLYIAEGWKGRPQASNIRHGNEKGSEEQASLEGVRGAGPGRVEGRGVSLRSPI